MRSGLRLVGPATGGRARLRVVVARSALRIKHLDLSNLPASEQLNAARLQALVWSPFDQTELRFLIQSGQALLMAWDARALADHAQAQGLSSERWTLVPEIMLCTPMPTQGVRLLQGIDGVEGQVWRNGMLLATRWWPELPSLALWHHFLRASGQAELLAEPGSVPEVIRPVWLRRPWAALRQPKEDTGASARAERLLVAGVALVALAATAGQLRQAWDQRQLGLAMQAERDSLVAGVAPVLADRSQALALADSANRLAARLTAGDPLGVMGHLAAVLPREGVLLKELVVEGRDVRIVLEVSGSLSRAALVSALQSRGAFSNVAESSEGVQRGWVGFTFKANSLDQATVPAAAASAPPAVLIAPAALGAKP